MKLDQHTIKVLANFSNINNSIAVKAGNELRTMPESKTLLAEATVEDVFPCDFAIYDLRKFLGCLSIYQNPDVEFNEEHVVVSAGANSIKMFYCNPELVASPTKRLNLPSQDVYFELSEDNLQHLMKTANILSCDDIMIVPGDNQTVVVSATDVSNPTSDSASMIIPGTYTNDKFKVMIKISNLKLIPGPYNVSISAKGISLFEHQVRSLKYYVAIDATTSSFGE